MGLNNMETGLAAQLVHDDQVEIWPSLICRHWALVPLNPAYPHIQGLLIWYIKTLVMN